MFKINTINMSTYISESMFKDWGEKACNFNDINLGNNKNISMIDEINDVSITFSLNEPTKTYGYDDIDDIIEKISAKYIINDEIIKTIRDCLSRELIQILAKKYMI